MHGWRAILDRLSWLQHPAAPAIHHGAPGIRQVGHRDYVGGLWDVLGRLQFDFLLAQGLRPHHYLLDIGCGCLRGGVHFIRYLEPGHYLGIDKEPALLEAGVARELGRDLFESRRPRLLASADFDFAQFGQLVDFALAQSVFTHLPPPHIRACLGRLRPCTGPGGCFFATFFESPRPRRNPDVPHDHGFFAYTRRQMEEFGSTCGWQAEYVGAWDHPRHQMMMLYRPR
jgi:hypothetical protein